jgi:hypothetical protein
MCNAPSSIISSVEFMDSDSGIFSSSRGRGGGGCLVADALPEGSVLEYGGGSLSLFSG